MQNQRVKTVAAIGLGLACILTLGCGNASKTANPGAVNSTNYNTYFGTQSATNGGLGGKAKFNFAPFFGGAWNFTRDDSSSYFTYQDIGAYDNANGGEELFADQSVGATAAVGGFASLTLNSPNATQTEFHAGGYALEYLGGGGMMRPGDATYPPVAFVQANSCPVLKTPVTYQFVAFGTPFPFDNSVHVAYGSIDAASGATDNIGSNTWTFANYKMYALDGTDLQPAALPGGTCAITQAGYGVNILPGADADQAQNTFVAGPTGLMVLDQGQGNQQAYAYNGSGQTYPSATGLLGLVGVQKPSSALDTGALVAAKYLGFEYSAVEVGSGQPGAPLISFGGGSGTMMTGGAFPNDDPTQTPLANIAIDLGRQDASAGLYKGVTVTLDNTNACLGKPYGGADPGGNPTCIFQGIAVAGQASGKYVVFVTVNDLTQQAHGATPLATLQFFLYQQ